MRALLSLLLSVCLLVSSVSPSVAQVMRNAGKGISAVKRFSVPNLSNKVVRGITAQHFLSVLEIRSLVGVGRLAGLGEHILALSPSLPDRAPLLRNEFVTVALKTSILPESKIQAVSFYRSDLPTSSKAFSSFADQNFHDVLAAVQDTKSADFENFLVCRDALSDAAALGLLGTKEDAAQLITFYEQAKGTAFEEVATAITARGLLRQGAYEEFSAWAKENASDTYFWSELVAYTEANGLPVELEVARNVPAQAPSDGMTVFLRLGMESNALNADFSRAATEEWMALGKNPAPAAVEEAPAAVAAQPQLTSPLNVTVAPADLTLSPVELGAGSAAAVPAADSAAPAAVEKQVPAQVANKTSSSSSGILYCGLPIFEMAKMVQKGYHGLRKLFGKKKASRAEVAEEPGLHENAVRPVYEARRVSPADMTADGFVPTEPNDIIAEVEEEGFKFTITDDTGAEHILPNVSLALDPAMLKTKAYKGYNRMALAPDNVFELRNQELPPADIDHFFFEMANKQRALLRLLRGAGSLSMPRPLRVKLEKVPNRRYNVRTLPFIDQNGLIISDMTADVDASLVPDVPGSLRVDEQGKVWFVESASRNATLLKNYYIRLPKEDSKYWTKIMQQDGGAFYLKVLATLDKTGVIASLIPALQIGWGKIGGRVLNEYTNFNETISAALMFFINNVLPSLVGFVHPLLKRFGEARVSRWGVGMLLGGGATALASGLYGLLDGPMTPLQTAGFLGAVVLTALGTSVTRYVQNILISANRGKVMARGKKVKDTKGVQASIQQYDGHYLWQRMKEVFSLKKRPGTRNGPLFQKATAMKNFGAMTFFAFPWLVNEACELLTGVNPGFNIMLSFVPYTLFAAHTFLKVRKIAYKDAFPMSISTMENKFKETLSGVTEELAGMPQSALQVNSSELQAAAKVLHRDIKALSTVEIRQSKGSFESFVLQHEQEAVNSLRDQLIAQHGLPVEQAEAEAQALQKVFDSLEHRDVKLAEVMKTPLLKGSLAAMALATVHELSVSSGFSFAMKGLQGAQDYVFAMTGLSMYGSMYLGRFLGNWMSRYISPATMYGFSSLTSILGTAMMASANSAGDMGGLIAGSLVASFGVGNFFAAMYEHMVNLAPQFQREISLLITYTMPVAAIMSMPMRWLVDVTGMPSIDLWLSEAAVAGSVLLTTAMLRESSLLKVAKNEGARLWKKVKGLFKRGGNNTPGNLGNNNLDNAAPAN